MKAVSNITTTYQLTPEEEISAKQFTELNLAYLNNERANIVLSRLSLCYDPQNPIDFAQQEAYFKGQLDLLSNLIAASTN
jgi:hypothetical protein